MKDNYKNHGAKHSPSDSSRGRINAKSGGPPGCVAWAPLTPHSRDLMDRFERNRDIDYNDSP